MTILPHPVKLQDRSINERTPRKTRKIRHMGPTPMGGSVPGRQRSLRLLAFPSFRQSHRRCRRAAPGPSFTAPQARPWNFLSNSNQKNAATRAVFGEACEVNFDLQPNNQITKKPTNQFSPCALIVFRNPNPETVLILSP